MKIEQNVKRDSFFEDRPADFVRHEHVPDECKRFFTRKGKGIIFLIKISQRGEKRNETRKRLSDNIYRRIRITTSSSSSSFLNIFLAGRATAQIVQIRRVQTIFQFYRSKHQVLEILSFTRLVGREGGEGQGGKNAVSRNE